MLLVNIVLLVNLVRLANLIPLDYLAPLANLLTTKISKIMKLTIKAINFDMADKLEAYIDKKTKRYGKLLSDNAEMEIRMSVVKPETNLNKEVKLRILNQGPELFASATCDSFEQALDQCLQAIDRPLEKLKEK